MLSALCPGCIHVLSGVKTRKRWHIHARAQILSPTLGQVDWFSWKTPLFQSHLVPPNLKTPLSQSHPVPPNMETLLSLSHPVPPNTDTPYPCSTCPTYLHLSQPVPFGCTTCASPTPFSQMFFFVSRCHSTFRKTLVGTRVIYTYTCSPMFSIDVVASSQTTHVFADSKIALLCHTLRICVAHAPTESCPFCLLRLVH